MSWNSRLLSMILAGLLAIGFFPPDSTAQFPVTLTVTTAATFVRDTAPSSVRNTFEVNLLETNPVVRGAFTFRRCTLMGSPADGATNAGNCQWTTFTDRGVVLLRLSFNFLLPDTDGHWGEFILVNTRGFGRFVRFWAPSDSATVGAASGRVAWNSTGGPMLSYSPSSLDFGDIPVGTSKSLDYTLTNTGDATLTGTTQGILDSGASSSPLAFSLEPGESVRRTLKLTAGSVTGTGTGRLEILSNDVDATIPLTFTVVSGDGGTGGEGSVFNGLAIESATLFTTGGICALRVRVRNTTSGPLIVANLHYDAFDSTMSPIAVAEVFAFSVPAGATVNLEGLWIFFVPPYDCSRIATFTFNPEFSTVGPG